MTKLCHWCNNKLSGLDNGNSIYCSGPCRQSGESRYRRARYVRLHQKSDPTVVHHSTVGSQEGSMNPNGNR